mgnify:CR=1 FL=1
MDEDKEYVWGIRVYVDGFPVSEIFMKPRIATPVVTMESKEYKHILILDQGEKKASYGFNLSLDVINQWEFTVEFEENENCFEKLRLIKYNADKRYFLYIITQRQLRFYHLPNLHRKIMRN